MSIASKEVLLVWQQPDDLWRWSWSLRDGDGREEQSLISNEAFESRSSAVHSAREAYPDVQMFEVDAEPPSRRRKFRVLLVAVAGATATLVVLRRRNGRSVS